jgi:N-acetylneuraminate lyase
MKLSKTLSGILPAVVTPFTEDGRFAAAPFEQLLERLYRSGVDGVYLCGSTGEGLLQSVEQRKRVTESALRHSPPGKQVIVHVGASNTADAIELAGHAVRSGATAVSSLPPLAGNYSFDEIKDYYRTLAQTGDVPLLLYYFPEIAPVIRTETQVLELCGLDGVAGVKFTDFDLFTMKQLKQFGATVYYGRDEMLAAGLLFGADGGIGTFYNVLPGAFVKLWQLAQQGRWDEMRPIQTRINEFIRISIRYPLFPAIKELLRWTGINCGPCLAPRRQMLTQTEADRLKNEMEEAGLRDLLFSSAAAR